MASRGSPAVLRDVQTLFSAGATGHSSDGQLLQRFLAGHEDAETAFSALVARHGSMVLGVCRRTLRNPDDVADAFQATFLVLVRKAGSIRVEDSLGRWLHGVSRRVAARARVESARRAKREPAREASALTAAPENDRRELLEALDEEVARLSAPFRAAIVLCDLDGLTHEAAAKQLGCPVGTIESRLSRARQRLRERLVRRGFASSAAAPGLLDGLLAPVVPEALSTLATRSALTRWASTPGVGAILQGVLRDMMWIKIKALTLGLSAVAILSATALIASQRLNADDKPGRKPVPSPSASEEPIALQPSAKIRPGDQLVVEVLEALPGRPISGTRLVRPDGTISLGFYGDVKVVGMTRDEIKIKVIEHLLKFLPDGVLGLEQLNPETQKVQAVPPLESDRVFIDDSINYERSVSGARKTRGEPGASSRPTDADQVESEPAKVRPGDILLIEVLKAVQGRPITGERLVRPDGTISLGFYGDLKVAGLNRHEIKAKVIDILRKSLSDEDLGLVVSDPKTGKMTAVAPDQSATVFVDESLNLWPREPGSTQDRMLEKLDEILEALETRDGPPRRDVDGTRSEAGTDPGMRALQQRVDYLTREVEALKREKAKR